MKEEHNCWQCGNSSRGRCFSSYNYGADVSDKNEICTCFVDASEPSKVTFDTVGQLENYLKKYFYMTDFKKIFNRSELKTMLKILYPYQDKSNTSGLAFSRMCKGRMVKHLEFYIKLHNMECKTKS